MWALLRPTVWVMLEYCLMGSMVMLVIVVLRRESLAGLDTVLLL
jgi:hypothetical protein